MSIKYRVSSIEYQVSSIEYQEMDYRKTLNLPETSFPMKADPARTDLEVLNLWRDLDVYKKRQQLNEGNPGFFLYNLPKPAYGHVCIDDALNMILKDVVVKYKSMREFNVPYFPGWNSYTPAIESEVLRLLQDETDEISKSEVRERCQSLYSEYIALQKDEFQRLGIFAHWDEQVLTSDSGYKSRAIEAFGNLYKAGFLRKGAKPTLWCINCQTDLNQTEVEYKPYGLLSLCVKFPVIHGLEELGEDAYIVAWIDKPWTLPANTAIAVHPDHDYVAVETEDREVLVMAASAVEDIAGRQTEGKYTIVRQMKGLELDKIVYAHPFLDRDSDVILDRHVSLDCGTGCVSIAPGYNRERYAVRRQRHPNAIVVVDQDGRLTEEAGQFCGLNAFESSELIALELDKRGCLLVSEQVERMYPYCPYCKKPIILRAAHKWTLNPTADKLRQHILTVVKEVNWLPDQSMDRLSDTIVNRSDWKISQQRIWGLPAPAFYCNECNLPFDAIQSINASRNMINKRGVEQWLAAKPDDILSDDAVCSRCGRRNFRWEMDILDSQFISAMGYSANSNESKNMPEPADVCVSSDGQNAKWFQLSLLLPRAIEELPPFKAALVHGYVVDEDGRRVSGSENETPSIPDLLDEFGTDVFRLWAASADCRKNLKISHSRLEAVSKVYRRVRNTCRFLLSNLSGYDPKTDRLVYANLDEIDHWALHRLSKLIGGATEALEAYRFDVFYSLLHNFCSVDMGSRYLNIVRRRLYTYPRWSSSRRAIQTVIYEVLTSLTRLIAPILSFTAEDIWRYIPGVNEDYPSVHLSHWPHVNEDFLNDELGARWDNLLKIRSEIRRITEEVRQEEEISSLSQASVVIYASSQDVYSLLDRYIDDLETIFMVSRVRLNAPEVPVPDGIRESKSVKGLAIEVRRTTGEKCERCWIYSDTVGTNEQFPTLCYRCIDILEGGTYYSQVV